MGKLRVLFHALLSVVLLMAVTGCGPEEDSLSSKNAEIRAQNEKIRRELSPLIGLYKGELISRTTKKKLYVILDLNLITSSDDSRKIGEDKTVLKLRAYFTDYDPEGKKDDFLIGVFNKYVYVPENGQLTLFNGTKEIEAYGIDVVFAAANENSGARLDGKYSHPNGVSDLHLTRVQE